MTTNFDYANIQIPKNESIKSHARSTKLPAKSTFDLPVEYHQNAITERFSINASIPFSKVIAVKGTKKRQSRFKYLDPKILLNQLKTRQCYALLRYMAVEKLEYDIRTALGVFKMIHRCRKQDLEGIEIPHRMFGWAMEDFMQRRQQENVIWIDVLMRDFPTSCLFKAKLFVDIEELERYMRLIFAELQHEDENIDLESDVLGNLKDAHDCIDIYNNVEEQKLENILIMRKAANKSLDMQIHAEDIKDHMYRLQFEEKLMSWHVMYPIVTRYQLNFHKGQLFQCDLQHRDQEKAYEDAIRKYHERIKIETQVCHYAVEAYFVEIEEYKIRIEDFNTKFNMEYDKMENAITSKRLALDKLKEHRKFLTEQMERFHEEIEHMRWREEHARQKELLQIQKKYQAELLKALGKKKGKGKGKGKKAKK